ncbi:NAD(P)-dependent alcohol dehydrogenase [Actinomadura parmotrematis]|uniref:NAD(P)-dependent alcohol dehydrogenase n=1 Tax=Actinomadura parmotrematis TaxID=2864039 RepID=A0ABS7FZQ8_9ACTN|nr:NAD(P)-dependent alcohol dehydrogenase [Actinomadura parmotrematis]MBW8485947.1 NAD(P)-dependent alcohol dehydrogenase [Actinomadura parmotrematis]
MAALTALRAVRDDGRVAPGSRVLVNGAAGGVGTFAVQLAKALGAEVTGVCGTRNLDLVRSLGADDVVDYTRADFTERAGRCDVLVDIAGNHPLARLRRALAPRGTLVLVGGIAAGGGRLLGPVAQQLRAVAAGPFTGRRVAVVRWTPDGADLRHLAGLLEAGRIAPVIDRTYPFAELPDAVRHVEGRHARGKVVVSL